MRVIGIGDKGSASPKELNDFQIEIPKQFIFVHQPYIYFFKNGVDIIVSI